jgi:hypothetical protein
MDKLRNIRISKKRAPGERHYAVIHRVFTASHVMVTGLCALPASLIAGIFWDRISIFMPFYFSLGLTFLSIILLTFVREEKIKK